MRYTLIMAKVYRIQSAQDRTRGAYSSVIIWQEYTETCNNMTDQHSGVQEDIHPTPTEDTIGRHPQVDEYCGFATAADLLRWFRGWILLLLKDGYEIVVLDDVEITAIGEYQVLFKF